MLFSHAVSGGLLKRLDAPNNGLYRRYSSVGETDFSFWIDQIDRGYDPSFAWDGDRASEASSNCCPPIGQKRKSNVVFLSKYTLNFWLGGIDGEDLTPEVFKGAILVVKRH